MSGIWTISENAANVTKANLHENKSRLGGFIVYNTTATLAYFQLHNKATAPAAAETPVLWFPVPAGTANAPGYLEINEAFLGEDGHPGFNLGIGWAISSTSTTFTDALTGSSYFEIIRWRAA